MQHLDAFVAGRLRGGFQVDLGIAGNHAHQNPVAIAAQHQRLEHLADRLAELFGDVRRPDSLRPPGKGSTQAIFARSSRRAALVLLILRTRLTTLSHEGKNLFVENRKQAYRFRY